MAELDASTVGLVLYAVIWVFLGDVWVSRSLNDFIREYEKIHRKKALFRSDMTWYRDGWKFLTRVVDPGRVWSKPQPEPELEALRQKWLSRRQTNFLGMLSVIPLALLPGGRFSEVVVILPYALALILAGYFLWPDLHDAWTRRRAWLRRELLLAAIAATVLAASWLLFFARLPANELANALPYAIGVVLLGCLLWSVLPPGWFGRGARAEDDDDDADPNASGSQRTFAEVDLPADSATRGISRRAELLIAVVAVPVVASVIYAILWLSMHF